MQNFFKSMLNFNLGMDMGFLRFDNIPYFNNSVCGFSPNINQNYLFNNQFNFFPLEIPLQQIDINTMFDFNSGKQFFLNNYSFNSPNLSSTSNNICYNFSSNFSKNFLQSKIKKTPSTASISYTRATSNTSSTSSAKTKITDDIQWWLDQGYDPEKGKRLCEATKRHLDSNPIQANGKRAVRGQCVGYVRKGINDAFYDGNLHYTTFGKAHLCGETYLSKDPNFKKITGINMADINPGTIPEGAIVLYYPGYSNSAASQVCGHGEVSNGQGKGYSDCLTFLKNNNKQRIKEIWIPV